MPSITDINESGITRPAGEAEAVTPSDTTELPRVTRAFYVGSAGNVKVKLHDDSVILFYGMLAGMLYPLRVKQIYDTDTTAYDIVALY